MLGKLSTSRSAVFYRLEKPFSKLFIEKLFKEVSKEKVGNYQTRVIKQKERLPFEAEVSFLIFKFADEPSFLKDSGLQEEKYAFLMLIEFGEYLAVLKKNTSGVDKLLEEKCNKLDYEKIVGLFSDAEPAYEKIALSNMGISKSAILRRTLESTDLKGQLSSQSSRRSIANTATVKTRDHRHTLRPQSASISKADSRSNFREILQWISDLHTEFQKTPTTNGFLESFAQPIDFQKIKDVIIPSALLLNLSEIKNLFEDDAQLYFNGRPVSKNRFHNIINNLEVTFFVDQKDDKHIIKMELSNGHLKPVGTLKINDKSMTIASPWLDLIQVEHPSFGFSDLRRLINADQEFIVTYQTPEYIYKSRKVFRDRGVLAHCEEIQACLVKHNFGEITSEKGEKLLRPRSKVFPAKSIFHFVESKLYESGVLICDDLGDEWADYVELCAEKNRVRLFHCKMGKSKTGVSQLHDVVSQALKNIGRVSFSSAEITAKIELLDKPYSSTQITKVRSDHDLEGVREVAETLIRSPLVSKEIVIVAPFLVKSDIEEAFQKLRDDEAVRAHIPQLIWLLSTFVSACKENGIKPSIYCS